MKLGFVRKIPVASFNKIRKPTIEETNHGETLCYEAFLGRAFRADPDYVIDICEQYSDMYQQECRRLDEDPAHEYYEATSMNDLYIMLPIAETIAGDEWVWTNDNDYRVDRIEWDYKRVTSGPLFKYFGEDVFWFAPKEKCYPDQRFREVQNECNK